MEFDFNDHKYWFLQFAFEVGVLAIFGDLEGHYREQLRKNYCVMDRGYNSYPTNIPGTPYRKATLVSSLEFRITGNFKLTGDYQSTG